ncbi:hypothetical protein, partial [Haloferax volcanii]|uniref:hypothetical protein n=1 Tax=Haloferax volcanii TaxID=2246 RepID=UPI001C95B15B
MDSSRLTSKLNALKDRKSLFTIALFALILLYTLTIPLIAYLTAQYTSLTAIDAATILTPIGTVLVSLLLAVLYYQMLIVQDTQVAIMDRQANWAEAANSPAVIINQWWTRGRDTVVFRLSNRGNSHVEKIRLLVDLRVNDTTTGKTVRQFESRTT